MIGKEIIMLSGNETEKQKFHYYKNRFFKKNLDIHNILISSNIASGGKKYKTLLVIWMTIIKLNHSSCFQKQVKTYMVKLNGCVT